MRFVICGAGAIGGVLGGQLAKAGFAVILIDTIPEHVATINAHGLQLKGVHGTHTLAIPAVLQARAVDFRPDDVIFLAVKAFHCAAAAIALRRATTREWPIFCAQNGVANEAIAARYFQQVNGVMVLIGAKRLVPGEVVHTGNGPVGIGTYPAGLSHTAPRCGRICIIAVGKWRPSICMVRSCAWAASTGCRRPTIACGSSSSRRWPWCVRCLARTRCRNYGNACGLSLRP